MNEARLAGALDHPNIAQVIDIGRNEGENVVITYEGSVKLVDFRIAKASVHTRMTQAGTLMGKVGYMSPEQTSGRPLPRLGSADPNAPSVSVAKPPIMAGTAALMHSQALGD